MDKNIFFTLINQNNQGHRPINFSTDDEPGIFVSIDDLDGEFLYGMRVDVSQLAELGFLLLKLSNVDLGDTDSVYELLEGYGCSEKEMRNFAIRVKYIANELQNMAEDSCYEESGGIGF